MSDHVIVDPADPADGRARRLLALSGAALVAHLRAARRAGAALS